MHFAFDEDQLEFRAQLRALLEKQCGPSDVREAWESDLGWSESRWRSLAQMGVVGLTVPERSGGLGLGLVDLVLLLEEAGRACLPEPLLETTCLAVPALVDAPGERAEQLRLEWLPRVAKGEAVVAVGAGDSSHTPNGRPVPGGLGAHLFLLERSDDGVRELHAVAGTDVRTSEVASLDRARRLAEVAWEPSAGSTIAAGPDADAIAAAVADRAAAGAAAMLVGVSDRMIAMSAQYALERRQFSRPIGSFQAIKHHLASALVRLEFSRPLVYRAAWSLDQADPDASVHASMAKAQASEAALLAARVALQVHGAIGYTWEHDLHLWMKRAWALAASWGDASSHRARVLNHAIAAGARQGPA